LAPGFALLNPGYGIGNACRRCGRCR